MMEMVRCSNEINKNSRLTKNLQGMTQYPYAAWTRAKNHIMILIMYFSIEKKVFQAEKSGRTRINPYENKTLRISAYVGKE
jgi:hypothetical protein